MDYDRIEFERIAKAKRGVVRIERGDEYVVIAHCHTCGEISSYGLVEHTDWYVSLNFRGNFVTRLELDSTLTYDALSAWITFEIAQHMRAVGA